MRLELSFHAFTFVDFMRLPGSSQVLRRIRRLENPKTGAADRSESLHYHQRQLQILWLAR
jgi:hypothetical protein